MYTVVEINNRDLVGPYDIDSKTDAINLTNELMNEYLKTYDLTAEQVVPEDIKRASDGHLHAFVDVFGAEWDAYIIEHDQKAKS